MPPLWHVSEWPASQSLRTDTSHHPSSCSSVSDVDDSDDGDGDGADDDDEEEDDEDGNAV